MSNPQVVSSASFHETGVGQLTHKLVSGVRAQIFTVFDTHSLSHATKTLYSYVSEPLVSGLFLRVLTDRIEVTFPLKNQ